MEIRRAELRDAHKLAEIFLASRAGMTYLPALHTDEETRSWIRDRVVGELETWVYEDEGRLVGYAALEGDLLDQLYVHPDDQGRGVGRDLLELVQGLRPGGFRLWVFQRNDGARRFYERHGLRLVELTDGSNNEEREPDALYERTSQPVVATNRQDEPH